MGIITSVKSKVGHFEDYNFSEIISGLLWEITISAKSYGTVQGHFEDHNFSEIIGRVVFMTVNTTVM